MRSFEFFSRVRSLMRNVVLIICVCSLTLINPLLSAPIQVLLVSLHHACLSESLLSDDINGERKNMSVFSAITSFLLFSKGTVVIQYGHVGVDALKQCIEWACQGCQESGLPRARVAKSPGCQEPGLPRARVAKSRLKSRHSACFPSELQWFFHIDIICTKTALLSFNQHPWVRLKLATKVSCAFCSRTDVVIFTEIAII